MAEKPMSSISRPIRALGAGHLNGVGGDGFAQDLTGAGVGIGHGELLIINRLS